ncbi:hypothetical protein [Alcanivorax sp. 1008]|uniref:hypothetical protein n=1 Tax=Alcanivorax sp. 1008 TaxID=2816853 RepID=UPI001D747A51|nr:hypothetical protein [Alcanivorax sp. 1008]MCC1498312.1 hypothetical protein [Alcanivorax sp. 1008]
MNMNFFNVVWQTLKERKPKKKDRSKTWTLLKWLLRVCVFVWKMLRIFFDEGGAS